MCAQLIIFRGEVNILNMKLRLDFVFRGPWIPAEWKVDLKTKDYNCEQLCNYAHKKGVGAFKVFKVHPVYIACSNVQNYNDENVENLYKNNTIDEQFCEQNMAPPETAPCALF